MSARSKPIDQVGPGPVPRQSSIAVLVVGLGCLIVGGPLVGPGLALALLAFWFYRGPLLRRPGPLAAAWLALLLGSLLGLSVSHNQPAAWDRLGAVLASALVFVVAQDASRRTGSTRWPCLVLQSLCLVSALAILGLIRGSLPDNTVSRALSPLLWPFGAFPGVNGDVLDVNSRFPVHQYGLAYLLVIIGSYLGSTLFLARQLWRQVMSGLALLLLGTLLAATEARGALLALALSAACSASLRSRWYWLLLPLGAAGLVLMMATGVISRSIEAEWLATRLSIWTRSLFLLGDYPFTGLGLGMPAFAEVFAWAYGLPSAYLVVHSHNIFIQAYAEQGLFGLVGLLVLLPGALVSGWRVAAQTTPAERPMLAGSVGALAGTLLYGLTDQVPTTNYGLLLVAALCGMTSARTSTSNPGLEPPGSTEPRPHRPELSPGSSRPARPRITPVRLAGLGCVILLLIGVAPRWGSGLALNVGSSLLTGAVLNRSLAAEQRALALQQGEEALVTATRWNPSNSAAFRQLVQVRSLRHDVPGAQAALTGAISTGSLNNYERSRLGTLALGLGLWQQAFDLWAVAGETELIRKAADDLSARGNLKAVVAAKATLVELNPDDPENLSNLAKAVLASDGAVSVDEALHWFGQAAELKPEARRSLARQLVLQAEDCRTNERRSGGRFDSCVFWFGLASQVDPTYDKPEVELGSVYFYRGLYDQAAEHFRLASDRDPRNASTWHQIGQAEEGAGRILLALAAYERAVALAPGRAGLRTSLGRLYLNLGRCDDARRELSEAQHLPTDGDTVDRARIELERLLSCRTAIS